MEVFIVPLMVLWLLISIGVGRLVRKYIWRRRAAVWVVAILINLAPWADFISNAAVAHWSLYRLGVITPEQPIEVRGFLKDYDRDHRTPSFDEFLQHRSFEYVEVQYTAPVSGTPAEREGPGYYQFRLSGLGSADCAAMSPDKIPHNVWRLYGRCYAFYRTNERVSRYASSFTVARLRLWPSVTTYCSRVTDLVEGRDVAQYCTAGYASWIFADRNESFPLGVPRRLDVWNFLQPVQPNATEKNIQPE